MEPKALLDIILTNPLPFVAFFSGVAISVYTGIYSNIQQKHVWVLSIVPGLLTVPMLMFSWDIVKSGCVTETDLQAVIQSFYYATFNSLFSFIL